MQGKAVDERATLLPTTYTGNVYDSGIPPIQADTPYMTTLRCTFCRMDGVAGLIKPDGKSICALLRDLLPDVGDCWAVIPRGASCCLSDPVSEGKTPSRLEPCKG